MMNQTLMRVLARAADSSKNRRTHREGNKPPGPSQSFVHQTRL